MSRKRTTQHGTNRRQFIKKASALGAGTMTAYHFTSASAQEPETQSKNDRPHVALVGCGGRGTGDAKRASKYGEVVAVCDADLRQAERAKKAFGGKPDVFQDYRKLLERKDIDIIINGTPDHWHTIINLTALSAGKDIYTEKPMTLTIEEGKLLQKAVKESGRVVQVGTQQRSGWQFQQAIELVRNGRVGKLKQVWVALPYYTTKGGPFPAVKPPEQINWDLYQGQAPAHDYCGERTHANFRWWYEYAGGIVTDWGNHHVDIAHWGMDCENTGPTSIDARGIFPNPVGDQYYNTPDRFFSRMMFPTGVELLYFASLNRRARYGKVEAHQETTPEQLKTLFGEGVSDEIKTMNRDGIMFIGDKGRVFVNRGGVYGKAVEELKENPFPENAWRAAPSKNHMGNFFDCVKSREEPVSPVRIQHRSISTCHLTNISIRLGRKLKWDPKLEKVVGDKEADSWQSREQRAPYLLKS